MSHMTMISANQALLSFPLLGFFFLFRPVPRVVIRHPNGLGEGVWLRDSVADLALGSGLDL